MPGGGESEAERKRLLLQQLLQQKKERTPQSSGPQRVPRPPRVPLTSAQERLYLLSQFSPGKTEFNLGDRLHLRGRLNVDALSKSLHQLIIRHESLRTCVPLDRDGPHQLIQPAPASFTIPLADLSGLAEPQRTAEIARLERACFDEPFKVAKGPLYRFSLARLGPEEHLLFTTVHNLIFDGHSFGVFYTELNALYAAQLEGRDAGLEPSVLQAADIAIWERSWLSSPECARQAAYWQKALVPPPKDVELQTDFTPPKPSFQRGDRYFQVEPQVANALRQLAARTELTLFMLMHSVFAVLIHSLSGRTDFCIGVPTAGLRLPETDRTIAQVSNSFALRVQLTGELRFEELAQRARRVSLDALAHRLLPIQRVVQLVNPPRNANRSALYQVMFGLEKHPADQLQLAGVSCERYAVQPDVQRMDLSVRMYEATNGAILGELIYRKDLFSDSTADRIVENLHALIRAVIADPSVTVDRLRALQAQLATTRRAAPHPHA